MIVTERDTGRGLLVTVCDDGLIGQTFENGDVSLEVTDEFYGGESVEEDAAVAALGRASIANLVGTQAVEVAIEHGFVDADRVLDVGETRHAQFMRL